MQRTVVHVAASVHQGHIPIAQLVASGTAHTPDRVVRHDLRLLTELDQHLYRNFLRELFWRTEHARSLTVELSDDIYNFTGWSYG